MDPDIAVDFGREAVMLCLTLAAPVLIVGVVASIVIGIIQSATQIQDQAVSFIPKIALVGLTFVLCLPWMTERFVEYGRDLLEEPQFLKIPATMNPAGDSPNLGTIAESDQQTRTTPDSDF